MKPATPTRIVRFLPGPNKSPRSHTDRETGKGTVGTELAGLAQMTVAHGAQVQPFGLTAPLIEPKNWQLSRKSEDETDRRIEGKSEIMLWGREKVR